MNGALVRHHEEGYTSFTVFLHNATTAVPLQYGAGSKNVVSVFVDATTSELWCYEGGGVYRHVWLESASAVRKPHIVNIYIYIHTYLLTPLPLLQNGASKNLDLRCVFHPAPLQ